MSDLGRAPTKAPTEDRVLRRAEMAMVATLVLAFVVGAVDAAMAGWTSVSDDALIELLVRDVPGQLPLVGVYSRYGWSHPGPALFYLLSVPYRLAGSSSIGLVLGAMTGQLLAGLATWAVVRRLHRVTALAVLAGVSLLLATTGAAVLRSPWNPHVALVGSMLLVALAWSTAMRSKVGLVGLLSVGTVLAQSHVVTAPLVAATVAVAAVLAVVPWGSASLPPWNRNRVVAALVGVGLAALWWSPPLVQQLTGDPGNLGELLTRSGTGTTVGPGAALGAMTRAFGVLPSGLDPGAVESAFVNTGATVPLWVLVPIAAAVVAVRRADGLHVRGLAVAGGALVGTLVGVSMISDALYSYLVMWSRGVVVVTLAIAVGALLVAGGPRAVRVGVIAAASVAVVANLWIGVAQVRSENPLQRYADTVDALALAVEQADLPGVLAVDPTPDIQAAEITGGLLVRLERDGREVTSTTLSSAHIGAARRERTPDQLLLVAPVAQEQLLVEQGWRVLTAYQPLDEADAARVDELRGDLAALEPPTSDEEQAQFFRRSSEITAEIDELLDGRAPMLVATRPG